MEDDLQQKTGEEDIIQYKLEKREMKLKHKSVLSANKRSQSFIIETSKTGDKFLPQRNSCEFHMQEVKKVLRENEQQQEEEQQSKTDERQIKSISLQSYSPSPKYKSSLEYIRSSSSSNILYNKNRLKSVSDEEEDSKSAENLECSNKTQDKSTKAVQEKLQHQRKHFNKTKSCHSLQLTNRSKSPQQSYRRSGNSTKKIQIKDLSEINSGFKV